MNGPRLDHLPAPIGRSQHVFRRCPLDAEIVSHLNWLVVRQSCMLRYLYSTLSKLIKLILREKKQWSDHCYFFFTRAVWSCNTKVFVSLINVTMLAKCSTLCSILRYQWMWLLKHEPYTCGMKLNIYAAMLCNRLSMCSGNLIFNITFQYINDKKLLH